MIDLNKRFNKLSLQPPRDLPLHVCSLITMISFAFQSRIQLQHFLHDGKHSMELIEAWVTDRHKTNPDLPDTLAICDAFGEGYMKTM